jgi:hypothetical protein
MAVDHLTALDLSVLRRDDLATTLSHELVNGSPLCFKAEARLTLAIGRNPQVGNELRCCPYIELGLKCTTEIRSTGYSS